MYTWNPTNIPNFMRFFLLFQSETRVISIVLMLIFHRRSLCLLVNKGVDYLWSNSWTEAPQRIILKRVKQVHKIRFFYRLNVLFLVFPSSSFTSPETEVYWKHLLISKLVQLSDKYSILTCIKLKVEFALCEELYCNNSTSNQTQSS